MSRSPVGTTIGLLLILVGLGVADVLLVEGVPASLPSTQWSSSASSVSSEAAASSFSVVAVSPSSSLAPIDITTPPTTPDTSPPSGAVKKQEKDILPIAMALGFTPEDTQEQGILTAVVQDAKSVHATVVLLDGDRAGLLLWVETPDVKQVFLVLKETLRSLFSRDVRDLLDETQSIPGKAPRNFLTFLDPAISEERLVFVRVRERLFEFHIAPGKEDAMYKLVEALTE